MVYSSCYRVGAVRSACSSTKLPVSDAYSVHTDPAQHLITADTGSTVDELYNLYLV